MRLTVLGNAGEYLAPLSGGSSYLVEHEGTRVLLDCGGGARAALPPGPLDAVVLSHFHYDHVLDLVTLRAAFTERTRLFVPPSEARRLDALATAFAFDGPWHQAGPLVEARPGESHEVGALTLDFARTEHSAPSVATRVRGGRATLVYASDGAPCDALRDLARDCDLLLMHTLLPTVEEDSEHARIHATAESAAALALAAGARRLLLSHRYFESPDAAMLDAAAHPRVELARTGARYDVA